MKQLYYRELRKYKYQLMENYELYIPIRNKIVSERFIKLCVDGLLIIKQGYAWDGPSGPTFDTLTFMRGSLVHDAIYQLIRLELLPLLYRKLADELLYSICLEDGMNKFRAWYVYQSVRLFAGLCAKPGSQENDTIICAPKR